MKISGDIALKQVALATKVEDVKRSLKNIFSLYSNFFKRSIMRILILFLNSWSVLKRNSKAR